MNILNTKYTFWLYKSKVNADGNSPVYMRITVGNKRTELSTGIYISARNWDENRQAIKGKDIDADFYNSKLEFLKDSFKKTYKNLIELGIDYTPEYLKSRMLGEESGVVTVVQFFHDYVKKMKGLLGVEYSNSTCQRYDTTLAHLKDFLKEEKRINDIPLSHLDVKFLKDFIFFMKTVKGHNLNTAGKYAKNLKTVIKAAIVDGYLNKDPFIGFVIKSKPVNMEFLNAAELKKIEDKEFDINRMENIRRIFLFQCYTGLAYCDIEKLSKKNIVDIRGKLWVVTARTKTNIPVRVPLIGKALNLIDNSRKTEKLFDVPTNQRFNVYLKELGDACGIKKNLCTHMARRTFATTVTLTNGVSIDAVSAMLGHTKISTTQIYAKVVPEKILKEMEKVDC